MRNALFTLLLLTSNLLLAQNLGNNANVTNDYLGLRDNLKNLPADARSETIKGSPYFENQFIQGMILSQEREPQKALMRYNAIKDQVEIKIDPKEEEVYVLPRYDTYSFAFPDYTYTLGNYTTEDEVLLGYIAEIADTNDLLFLAKMQGSIRPGRTAETSYGRNIPPTYLVERNYYFGYKEDTLEKVKLKNRYFRNFFEEVPFMLEYLDERRITTEEDVIAMMNFYAQQS
ncbi:hypothetical protein [Croceiramulus getboli]|nr:hypothetical protein P8624_05910 [Flavobacteriaceae bacterium YJPT1-3]